MKAFVGKVVEAYTKFSLGQMIATAVIVGALAGGVPMSLLAWAAVSTRQKTASTNESVTTFQHSLDTQLKSMKESLEARLVPMAADVAAMRTQLGLVSERTAGLEARLLALEAQRDRLVSADGFRSEVRRLDDRIDDTRTELTTRRRARERQEAGEAP